LVPWGTSSRVTWCVRSSHKSSSGKLIEYHFHLHFSGDERGRQAAAELFDQHAERQLEPERLGGKKGRNQDAYNSRLCFRRVQFALPCEKNVAILVVQLSGEFQLQRPLHPADLPGDVFQLGSQPSAVRVSLKELQKVKLKPQFK
jgi:hypothetical protein